MLYHLSISSVLAERLQRDLVSFPLEAFQCLVFSDASMYVDHVENLK